MRRIYSKTKRLFKCCLCTALLGPLCFVIMVNPSVALTSDPAYFLHSLSGTPAAHCWGKEEVVGSV